MTTAESLKFDFDELRATQAAAFLLKHTNWRDNYSRVIKILYIADRKSLAEAGAPISGGAFCNMRNGPLASEVYSCVKSDRLGAGIGAIWAKYICREGQYDIRLIDDPGETELSDFDVETLQSVAAEHRDKDFRKMFNFVHTFGEWEDPGDSSIPLQPASILKAASGVTDEQISELAERQEAVRAFKARLAV